MKTSMTIDKSGLDKIVAQFEDPQIKTQISAIPMSKGVAAIVSQAIADNFDKEGPGWPPLKAKTIRGSVSKEKQKLLSEMSDKELLAYERKARRPGSPVEPHRRILQRTGLLKKSVTVVGHKDNIWRTDGANLVWGTSLVYAATHNYGDPARNIPQREFLTIRDEWMIQLKEYVVEKAFKIIVEKVLKGNP